MRRARVFYTGDDVQMLKSGQVIPFVRGTPDFQILTSTNYTQKKSIAPNMWAKFETENMSGIDVVSWLERHEREIANANSCVVSLYSISKGSLWDELFVLEKPAVKNSKNQWTLNFSTEEIGAELCCADVTFKLKATFSRLGKTYMKTIYVNHLGVSETLCFIQNKIQLIEVSGD